MPKIRSLMVVVVVDGAAATVLAVLVAVWLVADTVVDVVRPHTLSALAVDTRPIAQQHHIGIYIDMELPGMACERLPHTYTLSLLPCTSVRASGVMYFSFCALCWCWCWCCAVCTQHRVWL